MTARFEKVYIQHLDNPECRPKLRCSEMAVVRELLRRADWDTGRGAYPTVGGIAARTACGESTVRDALRGLEAKGMIVRRIDPDRHDGFAAHTWRNGKWAHIYDLLPFWSEGCACVTDPDLQGASVSESGSIETVAQGAQDLSTTLVENPEVEPSPSASALRVANSATRLGRGGGMGEVGETIRILEGLVGEVIRTDLGPSITGWLQLGWRPNALAKHLARDGARAGIATGRAQETPRSPRDIRGAAYRPPEQSPDEQNCIHAGCDQPIATKVYGTDWTSCREHEPELFALSD